MEGYVTFEETMAAAEQGMTVEELRERKERKGKFLPTRFYGPHVRWKHAGKDLKRRKRINKKTGEITMVGGCSRCHKDISFREPVVVLAWSNEVWSQKRDRREVWYFPQYYHPDCYIDKMVEYFASHGPKPRKGVGGRKKIGFRKERNTVFQRLYREMEKPDRDWDKLRKIAKEFKAIGGIPIHWRIRLWG